MIEASLYLQISQLINMADREAKTNAISGQPQKITMDFDPPKKPKINKYAFTCALLATMTSVLLGYGQ